MNLLLSSISQGILWSILAIGVYLTFRILGLADLTVEGSFPLGAAVSVSLIVSGMSPILSLVIAMLAGALAGLVTGLLHTKLQIPALVSGIVTMTGLYSINLRVMRQANLSLIGNDTVIKIIQSYNISQNYAVILLGVLTGVIVIGALFLFFRTEIGLAILATGSNLSMSESNGIPVHNMQILGYMIGNGLIALSGGLLAQNNGYADVNMGIGAIVIGLASIIIGESIFKNVTLTMRLILIVVGSIIYRLMLLIVLQLNFNPQDLKLFSAIILAIALGSPMIGSKWKLRHSRKGVK
ncbi:MAG TPA: ABC transporter permease [Alloiococcus sp.]|nr:ABC transporter permease [Alloiococcus sp.]